MARAGLGGSYRSSPAPTPGHTGRRAPLLSTTMGLTRVSPSLCRLPCSCRPSTPKVFAALEQLHLQALLDGGGSANVAPDPTAPGGGGDSAGIVMRELRRVLPPRLLPAGVPRDRGNRQGVGDWQESGVTAAHCAGSWRVRCEPGPRRHPATGRAPTLLPNSCFRSTGNCTLGASHPCGQGTRALPRGMQLQGLPAQWARRPLHVCPETAQCTAPPPASPHARRLRAAP
jgi:hypothetical protein